MSFYESSTFEPNVSVGYLLRVTNQMAGAGLEHVFADEGMSGIQWQVMLALQFGAASNCAELARHLNHDKGAMTRLVDQIAAHGWITRERDADDRRHVRLALTDSGRDVALHAKDRVLSCWNSWLGDWSHEEIAGLIAGLQKLRTTLSAVVA
ncbi:MAG: MarR family transcriptional regulator [Sphingomonas bacterium]|nr:MarR family transcriptional regulator [Sphingomonas bacterium]